MPLLGFKKKFAADVEDRKKRQTIRAKRKYPIKVGDTLYLYTGLRTAQCRKLGEAICSEAYHVRFFVDDENPSGYCIVVDGQKLRPFQEIILSMLDGFKSPSEMMEFFIKEHNLSERNPFEGQIIRW